jgi:hypothetical protein
MTRCGSRSSAVQESEERVAITGQGRLGVSRQVMAYAKKGEVTKAERGYRLAEPSNPGA